MKIIVILIIISLICIIYFYNIVDIKKKNKIALLKIRDKWENIYEIETEDSTLQEIKLIYKNFFDRNKDEIDDITWNDLEMDAIYKKINYNISSIGEIFLYKILKNPVVNVDILKEREQIVNILCDNDELREKIQVYLLNIGKKNHLSIWELKKDIPKIINVKLWQHRLFPLLLLLTITVIPFNKILGVTLVILALSNNVYSYYKDKAKIDSYIPILVQLGSILNSLKGLSIKTNIDIIDKYTSKLSKGVKLRKKYNKYISCIQTMINNQSTELDTLIDYLRILNHMDLIAFVKLINFVNINIDLIQECYEIIGYFDCMFSVTMLKRQHYLRYKGMLYLCIPDLSIRNGVSLKAIDMYNPLLDKPVTNSINITKSVLITGSNATGKSTFLRSVGVNAILAQTIYMVYARSYQSSIFKIFTSMNIRDNILEANSCYMMEIKTIKRILDAINDDTTILCCMDEILRGTNTVERIGASSEILKSIALSNVLCLSATHDIELTYILENYFDNYHFQEKVLENDIIFDFCLYNGRSYTRNAIQLLKLLGYSDDIVSRAINKVDNYISTGKWIE